MFLATMEGQRGDPTLCDWNASSKQGQSWNLEDVMLKEARVVGPLVIKDLRP
jgi:hypothetical protein